MDRERATEIAERCAALKLIHGDGSTGPGEDIRVAVKKLRERVDAGEIAECIFGED